MRKFRIWIGGLAAAILFAAVPVQAAVIGYLEIPDIPGESQTVGGAQSSTVGAYQSETIKGGKAIVIGALWNGSENPPRRNSKGAVKLTLQRGALSDSFSRLKDQKRAVPELQLVIDGKVGPNTYVIRNVRVTSYAVSGSGASAHEEITLVYQEIVLRGVR